VNTREPLWPKIDATTSHIRGSWSFCTISRPFTLVARDMEGARYHSYERGKSRISPQGTMGAIGRKIGRQYTPQQRNFVCLITITTLHARCSGAGGRPTSQLRVDQGWDLTTGLCDSGRKIGRHYQPQKRKFVVLVTITTFHARCSGAALHLTRCCCTLCCICAKIQTNTHNRSRLGA
jgi:hypothetical protein